MMNESPKGFEDLIVRAAHNLAVRNLHPAWQDFVRFCLELGSGEIEKLEIQDGLPVLAEVGENKVKFGV